ncbi:MAG TPA: type II CRISPR-associated endonuclease Cas1 [Paludibacteraceae bacterium]|nr:type II CRISPR-associated endonuclease Cas1 [Paludibacteraceae bacterium]
MIKRTLYFGNPAYLHLDNKQLIVKLPQVEKNAEMPEMLKKEAIASIPVEDIGVVILDDKQVTITQALISTLLDNNVALISCSENHMPSGLFLPLNVNSMQNERFRAQIDASVPLKKQLWQQTIISKIRNQAAMLKKYGKDASWLMKWAGDVRSGDPDNYEAQAAAYYWQHIFPEKLGFKRFREGEPPNNLLNYGYAILRAVVARGLVATGLMPTLGIHHENKYNAYCLADDIMEPYRPMVDRVVCEIVYSEIDFTELNKDIKQKLLSIPAMDISIDGENSPLMVGLQRTTASLFKCFEGSSKKIIYPELNF